MQTTILFGFLLHVLHVNAANSGLVMNSTNNQIPNRKLILLINNNTNTELRIGQIVLATCLKVGAIPHETPTFSNPHNFEVITRKSSIKRKIREMWFRVSINDHLKPLYCSSGNASTSVIIKVLHSPTELKIEPKINKIIQANTNISCQSKNGYPQPQIQWRLIDGPRDALKYYIIPKNGNPLHLKADIPSGTRWKFTCSVKKILVSSNIIYKTVSFTVEKKITCDNECLHFRLTNLSESYKHQSKLIHELKRSDNRFHYDIMSMKMNSNKTILSLNNRFNIFLVKIKEVDNKMNDVSRLIKKHAVTNADINQIKLNIKTLLENNSKMKNAFKIMEKKIKAEISELRQLIKSTRVKMSTNVATTNPKLGIKSTSPINKNGSSFQWKIHFSNRSQYILKLSDYFYPGNRMYRMHMSLSANTNDISVRIYASNTDYVKIHWPLKVETTIQIANGDNPQLFRTVTKKFEIQGNLEPSPPLIFEYQELIDSGILKCEILIIDCFVVFDVDT